AILAHGDRLFRGWMGAGGAHHDMAGCVLSVRLGVDVLFDRAVEHLAWPAIALRSSGQAKLAAGRFCGPGCAQLRILLGVLEFLCLPEVDVQDAGCSSSSCV